MAPVLLLALALLPRIAAATTTPASYVLTINFLESLDITTSAGGGDTQSTADVGNTAHFALFSSDPAASYTTSSGVVFDTAIVPEPTTAALLLPALLLLRKRQP